MAPSTGLIERTVPWLMATRSLSFDGLLHVAPQFDDDENMILERGLFEPPVKLV